MTYEYDRNSDGFFDFTLYPFEAPSKGRNENKYPKNKEMSENEKENCFHDGSNDVLVFYDNYDIVCLDSYSGTNCIS